uniref:Retrovirus-related Pol polyprotein from transposon TNT 1-94 n=1 Tax=Cajanus cajan TaxID=3821 RepID=A0A151QM30_CAJCA|nr:Retrovirus-related Pol polyprotein from transposon TNT 1-94 [Cajanus cajan]
MRRKAQDSSSQSEVLITENRGKSQKRELKGSREKSRSKSKSRYKNMECYYCNKPGHIQKNCFL